jgi:hypothetical protein
MLCRTCGAVYERRRWRWGEAPADAERSTCPACHRIADRYPAGVVRLTGSFIARRPAAAIAIARNVEEYERSEHPLERIMSLEQHEGEIEIETTGTHLARGIGKAIEHALGGTLEIDQPPGEHFVRVHWIRDDA